MGLRDRLATASAERDRSLSSREELVALYRNRLLDQVDLDEVANLDLPQQRAR